MTDAGYLRPWQVVSTVAIVGLAVAATLLGLFRDGFYRDPPALAVQAYGQDIVTLGVVVPLLAAGLVLATRGSLRGYFLWLGALGYTLYTYAVYAVITEFNPFFLGYVALFGLSLYTFVAGVLQADARAVRDALEPGFRRGAFALVFAGMGVLVALLWLSEAVPATLSNTRPDSLAGTGLPANVVHVLDLAIVVPALLLTARWLRQGRPWGYVLAGVLPVKLVSIGLAVLGMIVWMATHGQAVELVEVVVFVVLTLLTGGLGVAYLLSIRPSRPERGDRPVTTGGSVSR